ncbi:hypothetical protein N7463_009354 [Penicillium fimorum]|uniref:Uncharacterized protein n=1 Tax=Penicillium fimorum TaxID=1882269 RepID=A0A9W9XQL4_9EURO|nr:hypothetical protein N7463_009354 [Penicillium fimorum]
MALSHKEEARPRRMAQSHRRETTQQTEWLNPGRRETTPRKRANSVDELGRNKTRVHRKRPPMR